MKHILLAITLRTDEHRTQIAQSFDLVYAPTPTRPGGDRLRWRVRAALAHYQIHRPAVQMDALRRVRALGVDMNVCELELT